MLPIVVNKSPHLDLMFRKEPKILVCISLLTSYFWNKLFTLESCALSNSPKIALPWSSKKGLPDSKSLLISSRKPFLDSALYDHFLTKLNDKIIKYGEEKMLEDLKTLQGKIQSPL